jgi:hypothetical protein
LEILTSTTTLLRDVLPKGTKYRESTSMNWKHSFQILMDSFGDYDGQWTKRDTKDMNTLSKRAML